MPCPADCAEHVHQVRRSTQCRRSGQAHADNGRLQRFLQVIGDGWWQHPSSSTSTSSRPSSIDSSSVLQCCWQAASMLWVRPIRAAPVVRHLHDQHALLKGVCVHAVLVLQRWWCWRQPGRWQLCRRWPGGLRTSQQHTRQPTMQHSVHWKPGRQCERAGAAGAVCWAAGGDCLNCITAGPPGPPACVVLPSHVSWHTCTYKSARAGGKVCGGTPGCGVCLLSRHLDW